MNSDISSVSYTVSCTKVNKYLITVWYIYIKLDICGHCTNISSLYFELTPTEKKHSMY